MDWSGVELHAREHLWLMVCFYDALISCSFHEVFVFWSCSYILWTELSSSFDREVANIIWVDNS